MGKTLSKKKRKANAKNAQRSTGPRTPAGKQKSRWNALRHGLRASDVVITAPALAEEPREFAQLQEALRHDLQPRSALEHVLVENIADCCWRRRRALRSEIGEIHNALAEADERELEQGERQGTQIGLLLKSGQPGAAYPLLSQHCWGLDILIEVVEGVQREVQQTGSLSSAACKELVRYFGDQQDGLAARCQRLSPEPAGDASSAEAAPGRAGLLLAALEEEKRGLEQRKMSQERQEMEEREGRRASMNVPSKQATERLARYRTTIERELHRSIRQLWRMLQSRKN